MLGSFGFTTSPPQTPGCELGDMFNTVSGAV